MKDLDDAYQRIGDAAEQAKEVDTKKKNWWKPILNFVLYPLIVVALIALMIIQFRIMSADQVVAVGVDNPEEETTEVPAVVLQ